MKNLKLLLLLSLGLSLFTPAYAAVTKLDGIKMGKPLHGPEISYEELKGRVVFVVQWNVIDGLSKTALLAAEKTYQNFESQGFVVIASQTKANSDSRAVQWCKKNKISFPVVGRLSLSGDDSYNVPRSWLFDWTGKVVAEGRPETVLAEVGAMVKKAPHWILGGRNFTSPEVTKLLPKLKAGKNLGKMIQELDKLTKGEPETAADAKYLKERLEKLGEVKLERAEKAVSNDPLSALDQFVKVKAQFKGHEISTQAGKRLKELKKDKDFKNNCKAYKTLEAYYKAASRLNFDLPESHPANVKFLKTLYGYVKQMKKKYPDSNATSEAEKHLKGLEFKKPKK